MPRRKVNGLPNAPYCFQGRTGNGFLPGRKPAMGQECVKLSGTTSAGPISACATSSFGPWTLAAHNSHRHRVPGEKLTTPTDNSVAKHHQVSEVYHVLGGATLVTGSAIEGLIARHLS